MQPHLDRQAPFWDARATDFPGGRDPKAIARLLSRLAAVPEPARPTPGCRILDVGAGTGVLAIHAARVGAVVTALDVSPAMLSRLRDDAAGQAIETVCADWRTINPVAMGWQRRFDSVFVQMVPSFREPADFARLEACSRGWCVFIGWGRVRNDPWLQLAFAAHGVEWTVPPGVPLAVSMLASLGRSVTPVYLSETWRRDRSIDAAVRDAADHLFVRGISPDENKLQRLANERAAAGRLIDASEIEVGVLAWRSE